jgi:hypothetical protein
MNCLAMVTTQRPARWRQFITGFVNGIITRARIGGRRLRSRLFSMDEVYKVALTNELVNLGISPSPASDAANAVWNVWAKKDTREG